MCVETRASRSVVIVGPAYQAAPSRKLGTSNTRAKAKAEAGRNHKETTRKAQVLRARAVLVGCNRIRVADSLGTATFAARQATGQPTARKREECKPCLHKMTKCFKSRDEQEFRRVQIARRMFPCRASLVTSESIDRGMLHTAPTFARQVECIFSAQA